MNRISRATGLAVVAVVVVAAAAAGAGAKVVYDAQNAAKVDGFHAVRAGATLRQKAGRLVAADASGRLPDTTRLGGYTHGQMAALSIPAQAAYVSRHASLGSDGPVLSATDDGEMTIGFVIPPDHKTGTPLSVRVVYRETSDTACSWYVDADGVVGPDGPNSAANEHLSGWRLPGTNAYHGVISVPAGPGSAHTAIFTYPTDWVTNPGMFMDFDLTRFGDDTADTCGDITVQGLEVQY